MSGAQRSPRSGSSPGRDLLHPPLEPVLVEVPEIACLVIDGTGDPSSSADFQGALGALFGLAYGLHFALKKEGTEARVMPLEGLFGTEAGFDWTAPSSGWPWTLLIQVPDVVDQARFSAEVEQARAKHPDGRYGEVRLERWVEGPAAQIMHVGPYSAEAPTIDRLHAFIAEQGLVPRGRHHEIYLGDPRRSAPERLRTVVRQPCGPRPPAESD